MAESLNISLSEDGKLPIFITITDNTIEAISGSFMGSKKYALVKDKVRAVNVFDILAIEEDEDSGITYTSIETPDEYMFVKETVQEVVKMVEEANKKFFGRT